MHPFVFYQCLIQMQWSLKMIQIRMFQLCHVCVPLLLEGHTDEDGEKQPAPVVVNIEGAERGKVRGTAPAVTTTAPEQPACLAGDACCECGLQSLCKTTRCGCLWAGYNCVSYQCLMQCTNVAPQTRQDKQWTTQGRPGDREGQRRGKQRRGRGKEAAVKARAG